MRYVNHNGRLPFKLCHAGTRRCHGFESHSAARRQQSAEALKAVNATRVNYGAWIPRPAGRCDEPRLQILTLRQRRVLSH